MSDIDVDSDDIDDDSCVNSDCEVVCDNDNNGIADQPKYSPKKYEILNYEQLHIEMDKIADFVSSVTELPRSTCRILLHHFNWSENTILEKYYESFDLSKYGVVSNIQVCASTYNNCCLICDDDGTANFLGCGHEFCPNCWKQYAKVKVECGMSRIPCPALNCSIVVPDEAILTLLIEPNIKNMFLKLITDAFVKSNRSLTFCPATDCQLACKAYTPGCQTITCNCGHVYCFECAEPWHGPIGCELLRLWIKQCSDDKETYNWINVFTKDCPNCNSTIEKDGGCNHMHCKKCGHHFCWICLQNWNVHGYSNCNRYQEATAQHEKEIIESRVSLERYLHYYNRYYNHEHSLKMEKKLYAELEEKIAMLQQQQGITFTETRFLLISVDILNACRRMLMYTYAFAFYLQKSNITTIFEDNQRDLEIATENLSDILENQITKETDFNVLRQKVLHKMHYVDKRKDILIQHCIEGTENNEWKFTVQVSTGTIPPY